MKNRKHFISLKKVKIVQSARKLIATEGMKNLTMRTLSKDLGLTEGALYRHFASKADIISLLIDDIEETLLSKIQLAAKKSEHVAVKLKSIFISHLTYAEQRRGVTFILINETLNLRDKKLQRKMFRVITKYLNQIEVIIQEGVRSGELKKSVNTSSAAIAFWGMVQSLITLWALNNYKRSLLDKYRNSLFEIYINSLSAK